jgi:uncharacterized protein YdaU (DUF1376 family)
MDYWVNGPPPDDDTALASIAKLDARRWRQMRPTLLRYFRIEDGVWRQKRADEELIRWAERKAKFAERGRAGGPRKSCFKQTTSRKNTPKSLLSTWPASASTEVDGPTGHSTLCGQNDFIGPKEVRDAFVSANGEDWCGLRRPLRLAGRA